VALMLSDDYQAILAENGLTPARESLFDLLGDGESAQATMAAASNARLTPAAPGWASVEGARILEDAFVAIANGEDVADVAAKADEQIEGKLN
jgi:N,N'-diacetylchitobiose transport system substrate-binding protein